MSSTQNSSTTHADGYRLMPCRTGFENTIAQRSGDMFSATASGDGVVEYLSKKTIRISYKDGSKQAYRIGRRYGNWSGKVIPHNLVTDLKVGDSVKENDILFYNTLFFTKDPWGDQTALKFAALGRVAFSENRTTLEDGSAITAEFAKQLGTTDCKTKYVTVEFQDDIKDLLPVGSEVDDDSILCTLLPPTSQSLSLYAEEAASVLKRVSSQSPRAHFNGVIEQYRVYYCGEIEEMSPSLALLTEKSDDELLAEAKQMGEPPVNAQMKVGQRINGKPIAPGTAVLETRLVGHLRMKAGDKISVGAQMKSVVGEVYDVAPITEDGRPIDVNFSQAGVFNRMVQSCLLMGAINTGMLAAEQEFLRILDGVA